VPNVYPISTAKNVTLLAAAESARSQAIVTTRASVLAAVAGLGALITIVINYRNSATAARALAVTNETFRIQERGHLTDRYTKAIEQLGHEKRAIRLGGIYALEQLAADTERDGDQATVVEVLSAFFRDAVTEQRDTIDKAATDTSDPTSESTGGKKDPLELPSDVLAAVTVLSRLHHRKGISRADLGDAAENVNLAPALKDRPVLHETTLTRVHLARGHLNGADFRATDLRGAVLTDANLVRAKFTLARLNEANLTRALLNGANLTAATLGGATSPAPSFAAPYSTVRTSLARAASAPTSGAPTSLPPPSPAPT